MQKHNKITHHPLTPDSLAALPKHALKTISKGIYKELKARYPENHHHKRYGNLPRNYNDLEWERFIKHVTHPKAKLAFQSQHYGGLRVGEVVLMKLEHIDWFRHELHVETEKTGLQDIIPICDAWFELLREWVNQHHTAILSHGGYLLWSDNPVQQRAHISEGWLRNYGAKAREEAGLNQVYGLSIERNGRKPRRLFRLTPNHSHRHSFGTKMWEVSRDLRLTQVALRHTNIQSTSIYTHVRTSLVHEAVNAAFVTTSCIETKTFKQ